MLNINLKEHPFAQGVARKIQTVCIQLLEEGITPESISTVAQTAHAIADEAFDELQPKIQIQPECKKGCSWCCYSEVYVTIPELKLIVDFFDQQQRYARHQTISKAHKTALKLQGAKDGPRVEKLIACPLLERGACSVHPIRPLSCRGFNSLSAIACEQNHGKTGGIEIEAHQMYVYRAAMVGLDQALSAFGFDRDRSFIELAQGLSYAYSEPDFFTDWCSQNFQKYPLGWKL